MNTSHRLVCVVAVMGLITGPGVTAGTSHAASISNAQTGTATGVSAGGFSACALTPAQRVKCWGDNDYGQLGIGADTSDQLVPVLIPDLAHVEQISVGGYHTCAVLRGGSVKCWGETTQAR